MLVRVGYQVVGIIAAADQIQPQAKEAVSRLQAMGLEVAMITGDNLQTAEVVARELGIEKRAGGNPAGRQGERGATFARGGKVCRHGG